MFTDGRDTAPSLGLDFLEQVDSHCRALGANPVASVIGRYYAMDRDNRWDRTQQAYDLLVHGMGRRFPSAAAAVRHYYDHPSESHLSGDEFVTPCVVAGEGQSPATFKDGDSVIFFNFRGDRPRQLVKALTLDDFPYVGIDGGSHGFEREGKLGLHFVTMTAYEQGLPVHVAFAKPPKMKNILGAYLSDLGLRQFRCAETEKYAHVTFFFNDYRDEPFPGEERILVPSPRDVSTYDQKPEMSAREVARTVLTRIESAVDDAMIVNFANGDMVGHTGVLDAAVHAIETVDECVGTIVDAVTKRGGSLIVTADHGNAELMVDPDTGGPHTAHTTFPVECLIVDDRMKWRSLRSDGGLSDLARTALDLMGLPKPIEMTGRSLLDGSQ
jgi:2,3-bisphosphoglycerate-independent phosphoglycerate mutase